MQTILDQFKAWGAKGIKVDFMRCADQYMVNFYERAARSAPNANCLSTTTEHLNPQAYASYPNVINYEGVKGSENNKWSTLITPGRDDVTLPFTRMLAGPLDYTPGAMLNAQKADYAIFMVEPYEHGNTMPSGCHVCGVRSSAANALRQCKRNREKKQKHLALLAEYPQHGCNSWLGWQSW